MKLGFVVEPERRVPVVARAEIVVLGGGPSGIAAAWAAARSGRKTILIERYGFLGGMGTAAMVTSFAGVHGKIDGQYRRVARGAADELLDRIDQLGGLNAPHEVLGRIQAQVYDNAVYKLAADAMLLDAGVELRFHCFAVGCVAREGTIEALLLETKAGRRAIAAEVFIDASGDGDLAAWAGAPYEKGDATGWLALPTQMFRVGLVDAARAIPERPGIRARMIVAEKSGRLRFARHSPLVAPMKRHGEWRCNVTQISRDGRPIDGTDPDDLAFAEIEGRKQVREYVAFLKRDVPGFEESYLLEIAPQVGIRETRRVLGQYQITAEDVVGARDFPDAIGVNAWPVERHVPGAIEWRWIEGRGYHQIPYRALLPRGIANLLVVGRCASATVEAQAAIRVSGPCFVMGQGAGTAAALAVEAGVGVAAVDIPALQARLRRDGAFLG